MSRRVVVASSVLPADIREHVRAFADEGCLQKIVTGMVDTGGWVSQFGNRSLSKTWPGFGNALRRRPKIDYVEPSVIDVRWLSELRRHLGSALLSKRNATKRLDQFDSQISLRASQHLNDSVSDAFAREMCALELFTRARHLGIKTWYQLPIAHHAMMYSILRDEVERFPDVSVREDLEVLYSSKRNQRKDLEISLADHVVVPSLFVKKSLANIVDEERIVNLPFGTEERWCTGEVTDRDNLVLHVGRLSLRKGTHRLLRVWKRLKAYRTHRLVIFGKSHLSEKFVSDFSNVFEHHGRIPRSELRRHYCRAKFTILPSLAEGFALVLLESLSTATPIVASKNSGAEGFIDDGRHGCLHDALDEDELAEKIEFMLGDKVRNLEMQRACIDLARDWTWSDFRQRFSSRFMDESR